VCNSTAPEALSSIATLPFDEFSQFLPTLSTTNCSDPKLGFPILPDPFWRHDSPPKGTATTYSDLPGIMTSPPYGSTTAWYFYGITEAAVTATAVPYKAGSEVSGTASSSDNPGSNKNTAPRRRAPILFIPPMVVIGAIFL
jgi:hypothetical protein